MRRKEEIRKIEILTEILGYSDHRYGIRYIERMIDNGCKFFVKTKRNLIPVNEINEKWINQYKDSIEGILNTITPVKYMDKYHSKDNFDVNKIVFAYDIDIEATKKFVKHIYNRAKVLIGRNVITGIQVWLSANKKLHIYVKPSSTVLKKLSSIEYDYIYELKKEIFGLLTVEDDNKNAVFPKVNRGIIDKTQVQWITWTEGVKSRVKKNKGSQLLFVLLSSFNAGESDILDVINDTDSKIRRNEYINVELIDILPLSWEELGYELISVNPVKLYEAKNPVKLIKLTKSGRAAEKIKGRERISVKKVIEKADEIIRARVSKSKVDEFDIMLEELNRVRKYDSPIRRWFKLLRMTYAFENYAYSMRAKHYKMTNIIIPTISTIKFLQKMLGYDAPKPVIDLIEDTFRRIAEKLNKLDDYLKNKDYIKAEPVALSKSPAAVGENITSRISL